MLVIVLMQPFPLLAIVFTPCNRFHPFTVFTPDGALRSAPERDSLNREEPKTHITNYSCIRIYKQSGCHLRPVEKFVQRCRMYNHVLQCSNIWNDISRRHPIVKNSRSLRRLLREVFVSVNGDESVKCCITSCAAPF